MNELNGGDLFTTFGSGSLFGQATDAESTPDKVSVEQTRLKWWESPLTFVLVIIGLLATVRFVEKKTNIL